MSVQVFDDLRATTGLVLPKTSGLGIKIDTDAPTYSWRDIVGVILPDPAGSDAPLLQSFRAPVRAWYFDNNDSMDCSFHIPHDYAPGSDVYIHVHWSHDNTAISGNISFSLASTYARRSDETNYIYPLSKTHTITYNTVDISTTPQYVHRVDEVVITGASDTSSQYDRTTIEVDGVVLVNVKVPTIPTMSGGTTVRIPIMHVDLHYQSTNMGTKNKSVPFWG
jgi:hypothetical protein